MDTLIFVDVDGVLNTVVVDPAGQTMLFSKVSAERALDRLNRIQTLGPLLQARVQAIVATIGRELRHGGGVYGDVFSCPKTFLSDVLVGRLAQIIQAGGERCSVVLTSTWRRPEYIGYVTQLEEALSIHLGRLFSFDARTAPCDERGDPAIRLWSIGEFVAEHCAKRPCTAGKLRLLVLEDFNYSPLGWFCGKTCMERCSDVENFLRSQVPDSVVSSAKLIHTYDAWETTSGQCVEVGSGLTKAHLCDALTFLGSTCEHCQRLRPSQITHTPTLLQSRLGFDSQVGKTKKVVRSASVAKELPSATDSSSHSYALRMLRCFRVLPNREQESFRQNL